jgi:tetratricopeptide (TPR) repeat protein
VSCSSRIGLRILFGVTGGLFSYCYAITWRSSKRALAIYEKAHGPDHPNVTQTLNNLSIVYRHLGRYADAELLYKRSLAIREKALGPDHLDVAQSLNNLALRYLRATRLAHDLRRRLRMTRAQSSVRATRNPAPGRWKSGWNAPRVAERSTLGEPR